MVLALVMASVLGTLWAWLVWIVVGGLAGALADRLIQGDKLGILGNIVVGIIGGVDRWSYPWPLRDWRRWYPLDVPYGVSRRRPLTLAYQRNYRRAWDRQACQRLVNHPLL